MILDNNTTTPEYKWRDADLSPFQDLIVCRNVAIYLPESVVRENAVRFRHSLVESGWLIVGAAETSISTYRSFQAVNFKGCTVYQNPDKPARQKTIHPPVENTKGA